MPMFHEGNRELQDKYGGRAVADRIVDMVETSSFTDEFREFVEAVPFFFLATSAGDNTDCSFKGGAPGFVRVTSPSQLVFPDYDGNRMYKSTRQHGEEPERRPAVHEIWSRRRPG